MRPMQFDMIFVDLCANLFGQVFPNHFEKIDFQIVMADSVPGFHYLIRNGSVAAAQSTPNWNCLKHPSLQITKEETADSGTGRSWPSVGCLDHHRPSIPRSNPGLFRLSMRFHMFRCWSDKVFDSGDMLSHGQRWAIFPHKVHAWGILQRPMGPSATPPACCSSGHPPTSAQSGQATHRL